MKQEQQNDPFEECLEWTMKNGVKVFVPNKHQERNEDEYHHSRSEYEGKSEDEEDPNLWQEWYTSEQHQDYIHNQNEMLYDH